MKIFGKRPFVLKTDEMDKKIGAINIDAIKKKISSGCEDLSSGCEDLVSGCEDLVSEVKEKLKKFSASAKFFKGLQGYASNIKKNIQKNKNFNLEEGVLKSYLDKLLEFFEESSLYGTDIQELKEYIRGYLIEYFEGFKKKASSEEDKSSSSSEEDKSSSSSEEDKSSSSSEEAKKERSDFVEKVEELEKESREAKQKFKDKFEKVYKLLKSCIKKLEKRNISKGIATVLKSEIDDFKKYGIDLDEIIKEIDEIIKKIDEEEENKSWVKVE